MKRITGNPWFSRVLTTLSTVSLLAAMISSVLNALPADGLMWLSEIEHFVEGAIGPALSFGLGIEMFRQRIREWADKIQEWV